VVAPASRNGAPSFGRLLRRHREDTGLTQEALAARSGLSVNAISMLERGRRIRPRPITVRLLADALELDDADRAALMAAAQAEAPAAAEPAMTRPRPPGRLGAVLGVGGLALVLSLALAGALLAHDGLRQSGVATTRSSGVTAARPKPSASSAARPTPGAEPSPEPPPSPSPTPIPTAPLQLVAQTRPAAPAPPAPPPRAAPVAPARPAWTGFSGPGCSSAGANSLSFFTPGGSVDPWHATTGGAAGYGCASPRYSHQSGSTTRWQNDADWVFFPGGTSSCSLNIHVAAGTWASDALYNVYAGDTANGFQGSAYASFHLDQHTFDAGGWVPVGPFPVTTGVIDLSITDAGTSLHYGVVADVVTASCS
jgi:transcriptional regulator with XRE-family HTH domain